MTFRALLAVSLLAAAHCALAADPKPGPDGKPGQEVQQSPEAEAQKAKMRARIKDDYRVYAQADLMAADVLFREACDRTASDEARKASMDSLLQRFGKSNSAGCALLTYAQMAKKDERAELLQKVIDEHSDCFYKNGVNVGAFARYALSLDAMESGDAEKALALREDVGKNYPDAIAHNGERLSALIERAPSAPPSQSEKNAKALVESQVAKFRARSLEDSKLYSKEELAAISQLYRSYASDSSNSPESKETLKILLSKYPKANATGCALHYAAMRSSGKERMAFLQQAIKDYDGCFYGGGAQVGPLARYNLAQYYFSLGDRNKGKRLLDEIRAKYPDAINFAGQRLVEEQKPKGKEGASSASK